MHVTYIKPPCILHGTSIKTPSVRLHERTNKCRYRGLQNLNETYINPPCIVHGTSIQTPSVTLHERTSKCRYRGFQNLHETYIKPPCILHGTSIKPASVRLHERTSKCRYRGLQNLHETYIKPPCILHGTSIKTASAGTHHMRKMFKRYWCKSMSNRSQSIVNWSWNTHYRMQKHVCILMSFSVSNLLWLMLLLVSALENSNSCSTII